MYFPFDIYPFLRPLLFHMDPEKAHSVALSFLKKGLVPETRVVSDPVLQTKFCGLSLEHPIGLAAGFDKQCEVIQEVSKLGFSFSEMGGVVPLPQKGNPRPRMFRLTNEQAIINRFNFNSDGFDICAKRVEKWYHKNLVPRSIVGINIAKGDYYKDAAEATILGLKKFAPYVDFVTVNVSCPNEPDARNLEGREQLKVLLDQVREAHHRLAKKPLLFVKISPDQNEKQAHDIAEVIMTSGIDAMIVGNTTASRPLTLTSALASERGGLSGKPLFALSTQTLADMYKLTQGKIPLIGCGGVCNGMDAYQKIRSGASLIQLYTGIVYEGPFIVSRLVKELAALLKRDGFHSLREAVGVDYK